MVELVFCSLLFLFCFCFCFAWSVQWLVIFFSCFLILFDANTHTHTHTKQTPDICRPNNRFGHAQCFSFFFCFSFKVQEEKTFSFPNDKQRLTETQLIYPGFIVANLNFYSFFHSFHFITRNK